MRTPKIKNMLRILDSISSVFSILALLFIYEQLKGKYFSVRNKMDSKGNAKDFQKSSQALYHVDSNIVNGKLAVEVWNDICGGKLSSLLNSPFFPQFSDEMYFISETTAKINRTNVGQRIEGCLIPKETGYYKFVLYSNVGSEFWFGANESLGSLKLAASVASRDNMGGASVGKIRFDSQISDDFFLERGSVYPLEIIHIQGSEVDFVELHWIRPGKHYLELVTSEYLSHFANFPQTSKIAKPRKPSRSAVAMKTNFHLLAFLTEGIAKRILPVCENELPVLTRPDTASIHNQSKVEEITLITDAKNADWRENKEVKNIVQLFKEGLEKKFPRRYTIVRLFNLERLHADDTNGSALYLLEIELACEALQYTERLIEYIYLKNDENKNTTGKGSKLCYPRGLGWNKEVEIHLIVAVNHEGQRLHRFIEKLEAIFKESLEVDFQLVIVHSGKSGLDVESILQKSLLQKYVVYELEGKFSRSRAINQGIKLVQDPSHVVLTADVHMDLPASVFDDCRKHCIEGKMIYTPVLYALNCGAYPDNPQGSWYNHGYQVIAMYKNDWDRLGGFDERATNEQAAWDLVRRTFTLGLRPARVKNPNLFRLFYSESRDSSEPTNV